MAENRRSEGLLLILALALGALGQFTFTYRRQYMWDGVLFWAAGIVLLILLLERVRRIEQGVTVREQRTRQGWSWALHAYPARTLMAICGGMLSITAGWLARERSPGAGFADLLFLWMTGVASFLLAFSPSPSTWRELWQRLLERGKMWMRANHVQFWGLVVLLLLALAVRAYDLEHIPANLGGDEGTWAMEGLAMVDGDLANPFATRWFAFPSMSFLVWGLSMRVFGETVAGVRTISALIGTASVLTTFLLAQELWNRRVGWLAGVALAFGHYHVHFSRLAVNNIADTLLVTSALYLLVRGLRSRSLIYFALAGAAMGAGWYGYFGARLLGIVVAVYVSWRAVVEHRFLARYGRRLMVLLAAALVVAAPLLMHYAAHPSPLTEGLNRVSIFASGWLARGREMTGRSSVSLLLQQFWKSISAFNYTLDSTFWYRASIPLLDAVSGVLFVFGLIWCMAHWRWPSSGLLLIWFWLALFTGWVMTENPPTSQRMVIVAPALALFVGLGLDWLWGRIERLMRVPAALRLGLMASVMIAIAGLNLGYYFLAYTPTRVYGNRTAEMTTVLARDLKSQGDDSVVYLHGPPFVYWGFGTLRFMAQGVTAIDVPPPGAGEPQKADLRRGARFVFHPARVDELEEVRMRYPGGVEEFVESEDGELLYAMYEVSR